MPPVKKSVQFEQDAWEREGLLLPGPFLRRRTKIANGVMVLYGVVMFAFGLYGMAWGCGQRFVVPKPMCRTQAWCLRDFVRLNDRIWSPPPLWTVDDYLETFPMGRNSSWENLLPSDIQYNVAVGDDPTAELRVDAIEDTWGEWPGLTITYLGSGSSHMDHNHEVGHMMITVPTIGQSLEDERQIQWLQLQHRTLWGLKQAKGGQPWILTTADNSVVFPRTLARFLSGYDPDMPVAFAHLMSAKVLEVSCSAHVFLSDAMHLQFSLLSTWGLWSRASNPTAGGVDSHGQMRRQAS
jgi:hypothetical protein